MNVCAWQGRECYHPRLGMALGHFADLVAANERDGYLTVGLFATCSSMPGMVAAPPHSGSTREPIRIGMPWLDVKAR
jgi:hypothetical protein